MSRTRCCSRRKLSTVAIVDSAVDQIAPIHAAQQFAFGRGRGISQVHAHQESIQLRLGQREGAGLILRILRGNDEEWFGQRHRLAVQGDLMLFHGLEQRALRLRRGPVDLIGQHQLRKDRTALEPEFAGFAVIDGDAEHVGRQQVAGELHALKRQAQSLGDRMREGGLAHPRNVFDQQMPARQQAGQTQADLQILAQDHAIDLRQDGVDLGLRGVHWSLSAVTLAICAANWRISVRSSASRC